LARAWRRTGYLRRWHQLARGAYQPTKHV